MSRRLHARLGESDPQAGVYAVLYAALVLVMIGMGAIVVDIATLREDRRDNRAAADSAALAGVERLDPLGAVGVDPKLACDAAWAYLSTTLGDLTKPADACAPFVGVNASTHCAVGSTPPMIRSDRIVGSREVVIAWPIPRGADDGFLTPNLAPGGVNQPFAEGVDGPVSDPADPTLDKGCDRFGVAIFEKQEFGLAGGLGQKGATTQIHSVARVDPKGGPPDEVAALNVLNPRDCEALVTTGGGTVLVGPTLKGTVVKGPGIIAVESDANGTCTGSGRAIAPTTGPGSLICASLVILNTAGTNCDGLGIIRSHALDPGGNAARSYDTAATSGGNLKPVPTAQGGRNGWDAVTELYGCEVLTASLVPGDCLAPTRNHIDELVTALGSGTPTSYQAKTEAVPPPFTLVNYPPVPATATVFMNEPSLCGDINTPVTLPPGNYHATCGINIKGSGSLILQGGTLVVDGGIQVASGGCLVVNYTTCTPTLDPLTVGTSAVSPDPAPTASGLVFIRGSGCPSSGCFSNAGTLVMPETFVYSAAGAEGLDVRGTALTLWTAPGAGPVDPAGHTRLERDCLLPPVPPALAQVDQDCLNSRFSRTTYWSEFPSPKTKPNNFAGQGNLNVVGVFFTPRAYFDFSGGGAYAAASAQFWADKLNLNGGARLGLSPDARFAFETPTSRLLLIR